MQHKPILILWPSFLIALVMTTAFFSVFDPMELTLHGQALFISPLAGYTAFFFASWALCALVSALTLYLQHSSAEINGFAPPAIVDDGNPDDPDARLRALVRRAAGQPQEQLQAAGIRLDPAARTVQRGSEPVALSTREFDLLQALMLNAGRVLSREQLEQHLYSWGREVESNAVEVHIHHLRKKLGADCIQTVRGVGYLLPKAAPAGGSAG